MTEGGIVLPTRKVIPPAVKRRCIQRHHIVWAFRTNWASSHNRHICSFIVQLRLVRLPLNSRQVTEWWIISVQQDHFVYDETDLRANFFFYKLRCLLFISCLPHLDTQSSQRNAELMKINALMVVMIDRQRTDGGLKECFSFTTCDPNLSSLPPCLLCYLLGCHHKPPAHCHTPSVTWPLTVWPHFLPWKVPRFILVSLTVDLPLSIWVSGFCVLMFKLKDIFMMFMKHGWAWTFRAGSEHFTSAFWLAPSWPLCKLSSCDAEVSHTWLVVF